MDGMDLTIGYQFSEFGWRDDGNVENRREGKQVSVARYQRVGASRNRELQEGNVVRIATFWHFHAVGYNDPFAPMQIIP